MKKFEEMTKEELWTLRSEITLCSLYISDYNNSFGFNAEDMCSFFEGYANYLEDEMKEAGLTDNDFYDRLDEFDNADNLYEWFYCCDDYSWVRTEEEEEEEESMESVISDFCRILAERFTDKEQVEDLEEDFMWIVDCAYENGIYGFGIQAIFNANTTAKQLIGYGIPRDAIEAVAKCGYYKCADDMSMVKETIDNYLRS